MALKIIRKRRPPNRPEHRTWVAWMNAVPRGASKIRFSRTCFTCKHRTGSVRSNVVCGLREREIWELARCGHWQLNTESAFLKRCDRFVDTKYLWREVNREFVDGFPSIKRPGKIIGGYYTNATNDLTRDTIRVGRACANCERATKATGNMVECSKRGRQWAKACCALFKVTKDQHRLKVMRRRIILSGGDVSTESWKYPIRGEVDRAFEQRQTEMDAILMEDHGQSIDQWSAIFAEIDEDFEAREATKAPEFVGPRHPYPEIWHELPEWHLAIDYMMQKDLLEPDAFEAWLSENWEKHSFAVYRRIHLAAIQLAKYVPAEVLADEIKRFGRDRIDDALSVAVLKSVPPDVREDFDQFMEKSRMHIELWMELWPDELDEYLEDKAMEDSNQWSFIEYE